MGYKFNNQVERKMIINDKIYLVDIFGWNIICTIF